MAKVEKNAFNHDDDDDDGDVDDDDDNDHDNHEVVSVDLVSNPLDDLCIDIWMS